jgi:citrate lyase subunit beta/citryl-CoA lyase
MPASNARAVEKARSLPADVIILDLEDAVAPEAKPAARAAAVEAVKAGGFGRREVVIRINGLNTEWGREDLAAASAAGPNAVLAPKISSTRDVAEASAAMNSAPAATMLWAMIETCPAVFELAEIARSARESRLSAFVMGINDLAKEMGARQTPGREPFWGAMGLSVAAARAEGLAILDGVHNDIDNLESLEAVCLQGRDFGFDGKTLIHPTHLGITNRVFSPDPDEVAWSRAVIAAFAAPENAGRGALRVEGRLAEYLHLAQAKRLVALSEAIAEQEAA